MASTLSSRTFLLIFWFWLFVVVFIVIRLIVISYLLPMHEEHLWSSIESRLRVFIDFCWKLLNLLSVKTIFQKKFLNINQFKTYFHDMSEILIKNQNPFLSFYSNLNYFGYRFFLTPGLMASMPQDFKKFFKFLDMFVFLVPVEIFSHYPNIDISHWFREGVKGSIEKIFRCKDVV